jgi:Elongation factor Tu GTP binding domain
MNARPDHVLFDADDAVAQHERKSLLRFVVCGSVDHGKSTLIGRLLYESGLVLADQLEALDLAGGRRGENGEELDAPSRWTCGRTRTDVRLKARSQASEATSWALTKSWLDRLRS